MQNVHTGCRHLIWQIKNSPLTGSSFTYIYLIVCKWNGFQTHFNQYQTNHKFIYNLLTAFLWSNNFLYIFLKVKRVGILFTMKYINSVRWLAAGNVINRYVIYHENFLATTFTYLSCYFLVYLPPVHLQKCNTCL